MTINDKAFKYICATCRHLRAVETGREFERIIDTEYTKFTCDVLGWETREFYMMAPTDKDISENQPHICEFWEEWISEENTDDDI